MRMRTGALVSVLIVGLVSCTALPFPDPGPPSAPPDSALVPEFPPLPAVPGAETGSSDVITAAAAVGSSVVAVGMVNSNRLVPVFRHSRDGGATWQLGGLSEESAANLPPDVNEEVVWVAATTTADGRTRWLALGSGEDRVAWTSADGITWDRHPLPVAQLSDQDSVRDLAAVPGGFLLVGTCGDDPTVWRSADGLAWTAERIGGDGSPVSVAVRGSRVSVVGSTTRRGEDSYASWISDDLGRTWSRGYRAPAPTSDSGFSRQFDAVTATESGFAAIGSFYADGWRPSLHTSVDGRTWRLASAGAMGRDRTSGDDLLETDGRALAVTSQREPTYQPRLWTRTGRSWKGARTPLDGREDLVRGFSWAVSDATRIDGGWLVVAGRDDNGRVLSQLWRSDDEGRTFTAVATPRSPAEQPFVWPRGVVRQGDQTVVVGDSRRRPVVWRRAGTEPFGDPSTVSDRVDERVDGMIAGADGTLLALGSRSADGDDTGRTWRWSGSDWTASALDAFSEANNDYASSTVRDAIWWRKRWLVVGSTTRNGGLNASALAATSTDGIRWTRGRGATTFAEAGGDVWYDVTDLEGDHDRTRAMVAVAATGKRLVAVGSSSEGDQDRATVWTSTDGRRWSMTRLPRDGLVRSRLSDVAARGSTLVAVGTGAAEDTAADRLMTWTSGDGGWTWRRQALDEALSPEEPLLAATAAGFAVVSARTDPVVQPVVLVAADGSSWRERPFDALDLADDVGAFATGATVDGPDLLLLVRVLARGDRGVARLVRQPLG